MKNKRGTIPATDFYLLNHLNEAYQKVLIWFFSYPDNEITLSDLSEKVGISKTTANRIVRELEVDGFLEVEKLGKIWRIACNKKHPQYNAKKLAYNLLLLFENSIMNQVHKRIPNPIAVILFGSYRKGDDTEKSDIDIAVEVIDNQDLKVIQLGIIEQLGYKKNVPVNLHVFSRNKIDLNLFANIANGIVLDGFLEVGT